MDWTSDGIVHADCRRRAIRRCRLQDPKLANDRHYDGVHNDDAG